MGPSGRRTTVRDLLHPVLRLRPALGDTVETDAAFDVVRVGKSSGRYVFRVWFGGFEAERNPVVERLVALGALLEWSTKNLLAVDAADEKLAQTIADASPSGSARSTSGTRPAGAE